MADPHDSPTDFAELDIRLLRLREKEGYPVEITLNGQQELLVMALPLIDRLDCAKCHLISGFQWVQPASDWSFVPHACIGCHEPASTPSRSPVAADRDRLGARVGDDGEARIGEDVDEERLVLRRHPGRA